MDALAETAHSAVITCPLPAGLRTDKKLRKDLHLLPCRIEASGPAPVATFFQPTLIEEKNDEAVGGAADEKERQFFDARLRGRQLTGSRVYLPQSALGLVVQETVPAAGKSAAKAKAPVADDDGDAAMETKAPETRHWKVNAVFDSFFVWNRDQNRYERDGVKNTLNEWLAVSRAIHAPVTAGAASAGGAGAGDGAGAGAGSGSGAGTSEAKAMEES